VGGAKVFVIGGGPSLEQFDLSLLEKEDTICVNQAVFDVPNPTYLITCDYTFLHKVGRQRVANSPAKKIFVAQFIGDTLQDIDSQIVDTQHNMVYDLSPFDQIIRAKTRSGLGLTFSDFRSGGNSGYCGLQLAVLPGYREIRLLGFDLGLKGRRTHYHDAYRSSPEKFQKKLDAYLKEFIIGIEQLGKEMPEVEIYSSSPFSRLNDYIPMKEGV